MRATPFTTLPLLLALAACKPSATPAAQDAAAPAETPPVAEVKAEPPACPETDFDAFLARFEGDADAQRAATADPLPMDHIDPDAQPEPARVTRLTPLSEVTFPLMPARAAREADGLRQTVVPGRSPVERVVTHAVPDTGTQFRYTFRADPCWTLVRFSDDSM